MKAIPAISLFLYPILMLSAFTQPAFSQPSFTQPPMSFPSQFPMQRMQRMPYTPQSAYPAQYPYPYQQQMPQAQYGYPAMQQGYPQQQVAQGMPPLSKKPQKPFREYSGYLGLITDIVPSSVIAQLPNGVTQGVLFKSFSKNSPASSSDLKPFDVMFSYNKIPLNHPAQLIKLIRKDEPGSTAIFQVVRKGKILEVAVTLGSQKTPNPKDVNGLEIKQTGKSTYRAIIHFLGPNGNKQLRSFQGTKEDIFDEVLNTTGLPQAERQQLLFAMQARRGSNSGFGSFLPFGNNGNKDWKFMDPGKYFKW